MEKKLHLGCGEKYFDGYVNIDYPLTEHSVQKQSVADVQADLLKLEYPAESISEIRLHHVFEHFSRACAAAQLCRWNQWLENEGVLRIEVPDFEKTAKVVAGGFFSKKPESYVALRHIFGSQEAHWAIHYHGYTEKILSDFLLEFGFKQLSVQRSDWKGTYNIDVTAIKIRSINSTVEAVDVANKYLRKYLVDESESELRLLDAWMEDFNKYLDML